MSGMKEVEEGGGSLFDLWGKLKEGRRYVVVGLLLGVLGAVAVLFFTPYQYQAVAVVQVAKVGQLAQASQAGMGRQVNSMPAEPAAQAVERMKSPAFQLAVAKALDDQRWMTALQNGGGGSVLSVASPKGALQVIDLKANAESPEAAQKIVSAVIEVLAKRHAEIVEPAIDRLTLEANLAQEKLKHAESELAKLNKLASGVGVKDERFTQISLITDLRVKKEAEIFQQRQTLSDLNGALSPPNTQPAQAIEEVFIFDKPVSPKRAPVLALGLVGGLLAGVISAFLSSAWRQARERRSLAE